MLPDMDSGLGDSSSTLGSGVVYLTSHGVDAERRQYQPPL